MAFFGTDGDNTAGVLSHGTPDGASGTLPVTQNVLFLFGGAAPENGTPTGVSIYAGGATAGPADIYLALYQGGSSTDPTGATLIAVTANITTDLSTAATWRDYSFTGTPSPFTASQPLWFGILARGASSHFYNKTWTSANYTGNYKGGWTYKTNSGNYDYAWAVTDGSSGAPSGTVPGSGAYASYLPFVAYITYTAGGASAVIPKTAGLFGGPFNRLVS